MDDAERRGRLVVRHRLDGRATDALEAARAVVALHSSDPLTPFLAVRARADGAPVADLERALYEDRTLWRLHAMRRTLFVVPADEAAVFEAGAGRDVAAKERRRVERWVGAEVDADDVGRWVREVEERVLSALTGGLERSTRELRAAVPELDTEITLGSGRWTTRAPLSSRLPLLMAMEGRIVRTRPAGTWRSSQYRWADASAWFGRPLSLMGEAEGRAELARRYLYAYGPATITDLRWWTGWTARDAGGALDDVGAVAVDLDSGDEGFVLADDLDPVGPGASHVSLLPGLDPTPMGWKQRDWYLGAGTAPLFDRNGNVGPTVWVDGEVVGGWAQRPDGEVVLRMLRDVGDDASRRAADEAAALTAWMGGVVATPRFRTPLERELSA